MPGDEAVVFDVNETLLDLSALATRFETVLPADLMGLWFSILLRNSMVASLTGEYDSFDKHGVDALMTTARGAGRQASYEEAEMVVAGLKELPPHPDAAPALATLVNRGIRVAALTNSSHEVVAAQLENAGLIGYFESVFSVEAVSVFKPAPETYLYAASELGIEIGSMWMVAAHDWDITGAIRAGANGVFVARRNEKPGRLSARPNIIASGLDEAVGAVVAVIGSG